MKRLLKKSKVKKIVALAVCFVMLLSGAVLSTDIVKRVSLTDGDKELILTTYSSDTHKILSQADISLEPEDEVRRGDKGNAIFIEVLRAFPVLIRYHNLEYVEFVTGGTVNDVLKKAQIRLSPYDVINISGDTYVTDSMKIEIDEVKYIKDSKLGSVKFDTRYEESDDYPLGYEEIIKKGKNGKQEVTTTYRYVNGERETACGVVTEVISKPKDQVVLKGTAHTVQTSDIGENRKPSPNNSTSTAGTVAGLSYSKVLTGSATAYTASAGALTSTGVPAYVGGVAVNPNIIPYGSKLYIVADGYTYGYATAVDTGGALMSGTALVDLYMSTYDECINFGRRNVTVYVLS